MRKHLNFVYRSTIFLIILCVCIKLIYQIITPKVCYEEMLPTTLSYIDFYNMEKDTVDVLFLGSSLAATAYIPQELYNQYGIRSYSLASEKQSPIISYYWLKEALRYQSPRVIVLDCYYFFATNSSVLNTSEISVRRAMDYMKWSSVKLEAVRTICKLDQSQSLASYFFPNIRYHERWKELTETDFSLTEMVDGYDLKGYAPLEGQCGYDEYLPYDMGGNSKKIAEMSSLMESYLDKICGLCEQEGISLVLANVPLVNADAGRFYAMQKYAEDHKLQFLDFNEKSLYEASGYDFPTDSYDCAHTNLWGAKKITTYLGNVLAEQYHVGEKSDVQWESTKDFYEGIQKDCELVHITDIDEYIEAVHDDRYSVFISAKGSYAVGLKDTTVRKLRGAGLQFELQPDDSMEDFYCYYAVLSGKQTEEYIGYEEKVLNSSFRNGLVTYDITGDGSIVINGEEESIQGNGLNIVIYHNDKKKVLDSVCFDTTMEENIANR